MNNYSLPPPDVALIPASSGNMPPNSDNLYKMPPYQNYAYVPNYTPRPPGFVPTYQPPPPSSYIPVTNLPNYEFYNYHQQLIQDQVWINSWLAQIGKNIQAPLKDKDDIHISEAQQIFKQCFQIVAHLKETETYLRKNVTTAHNMQWEQKLIEIDKQKATLLHKLSQFDDANLFKKLKRKIKTRKYKRVLQKRKKLAHKAQSEEIYAKRKQLHDSIDQWLEEQKDNVEKAKREEYLKRDADCVLSEVTKKKTDARKQLALLTALVKLRTVRDVAALGRGEKLSTVEDSDTFTTITDRLKNMWEKALKTYSIEEQGLKLMLDHKFPNDDSKMTKNRQIRKEWETAIFGQLQGASEAFWKLTSASRDLETFIAIRKSWDTFLTIPKNQQGSLIPIGWILPSTPTSNEWAKYLEN